MAALGSCVQLLCLSTVIFVTLDNTVCAVNMDKDEAMRMLKKYHYMGPGHPDPAMSNDSMYSEALKMYQRVAGLAPTGQLDEDTKLKMKSRRCGMPDIMGKGNVMKRRRKRYVLSESKWQNGIVSYRYGGTLPTNSNLTKTLVNEIIDKAFETWAKVANLTFTKQEHNADIAISFESGDHGDGQRFDGQGGEVAHAYYPADKNFPGDIHFDDDELWISDNQNIGTSKRYTQLSHVALHEIGHSLGLEHSMENNSIMYMHYPDYRTNLSLTEDDINGITAIYGSRHNIEQTRMTPKPTDNTADLRRYFCGNGTVDAIGTLGGILFVFQGDMYAELDESGIRHGFPRLAALDWPQIPSSPDAALAWDKEGILLIFKDEKYWRYSLGADKMPKLTNGYPRLISDDFTAGLPPKVDSAFEWGKNGYTYIVTDGKYYRLRPNYEVHEDRIKAECDRWYYFYPKDFKKHWEIPDPITDAANYDTRTLFFMDKDYSRYNDQHYGPDDHYPKSTSKSWFGCYRPKIASLRVPMEMVAMEHQSQFVEVASILTADANINVLHGSCMLLLVVTVLICWKGDPLQ